MNEADMRGSKVADIYNGVSDDMSDGAVLARRAAAQAFEAAYVHLCAASTSVRDGAGHVGLAMPLITKGIMLLGEAAAMIEAADEYER